MQRLIGFWLVLLRGHGGVVAPEGRGTWDCFSGSSVGRLVDATRLVAPRQRVSCRRGTGGGGGEPYGGAGPIFGDRAGRGHCDIDAADADAHERADLEQLETKGAAGGVGEGGALEGDPAHRAQQ